MLRVISPGLRSALIMAAGLALVFASAGIATLTVTAITRYSATAT